MIDTKELKKIARLCQRSGIVRFKSGDFEIEINPKQIHLEAPKTPQTEQSDQESFPSWDSLSPEQKLLWSATPDIETQS